MTILRYSQRANDFFTNQLMNQLFRETRESFQTAVERDMNLKTETNVLEEKDHYLLEMAIPGFAKEEVNIKVEDGFIKISGKKEYDNEDKKYLRREFGTVSLERSFRLSESIDQDAISAEVKNGVLNIVLPKIKKEGPKALNIKIK